jgi:hypothetical protein
MYCWPKNSQRKISTNFPVEKINNEFKKRVVCYASRYSESEQCNTKPEGEGLNFNRIFFTPLCIRTYLWIQCCRCSYKKMGFFQYLSCWQQWKCQSCFRTDYFQSSGNIFFAKKAVTPNVLWPATKSFIVKPLQMMKMCIFSKHLWILI